MTELSPADGSPTVGPWSREERLIFHILLTRFGARTRTIARELNRSYRSVKTFAERNGYRFRGS